MDGETAYWYARLRLKENDIGRSNRQRQLIWALRDQALNKNLIVQLPVLWQAFNKSFSSDLTLLQMIELASFGISVEPGNVRASGITLRELTSHTTEQGASVLIITDPDKVQAVVDGVWDAPAMVNANAKDADRCEPIPTGSPSIPTTVFTPAVKVDAEQAPATNADEGEATDLNQPTGG